jgi:flagellar biosynthesis/type III secretory pathway chaperone
MSEINQIVRKATLLAEIDFLEKKRRELDEQIELIKEHIRQVSNNIDKRCREINEIGEELLKKEQESLIKSNQ